MDSYEVFVTVVEAGNFASAAKRLGVTSSAISKQISRLEKQLNVQLLTRSTRSIALTEPGLLCFEKYSLILKQRREMEEQISQLQDSPCGTLKITATPAFGQTFLMKYISKFRKIYPDIKIELDLSGGQLDIIQRGFDLAIREGKLPENNLNARKLTAYQTVACCTPEFFKERNIRTVNDLVNSEMILFSEAAQLKLSDEGSAFQLNDFKNIALKVNHFASIKSALLQGVGFTFLPRYLVEEELRDGSLVDIEYSGSSFTRDINAVYSSNKGASGKVRAFIDFLIQSISEDSLLQVNTERSLRKVSLKLGKELDLTIKDNEKIKGKTLKQDKPSFSAVGSSLNSPRQLASEWASRELSGRQQVA